MHTTTASPPERMAALSRDQMSPSQSEAADRIEAGPRGTIKGPFIALLRSPALMDSLQKVGEYLRFESVLLPKIREMVILITARRWTNQFEWFVHSPLALEAGLAPAVLEAIAHGRRPSPMTDDETCAYDVCDEMFRTCGVSDATYAHAIDCLGEQGLVDLLGVAGYFTTMSIVLNVARTPAPGSGTEPLRPFPL